MPIDTIFCPSNHLILGAARCTQCGWTRPQPPGDGKPLWEPRKLPGSLGLAGLSKLMQPAIVAEIAVFVLAQTEKSYTLWGLDVHTGKPRWGALPLGESRYVNNLYPDGSRILFTANDIAGALEQHIPAMLHALNPQTGEITEIWHTDTESMNLYLTPVDNHQLVLVSSKPELIVLRNQAQPNVIWHIPLPGNTKREPQVFGDVILLTTPEKSGATSPVYALNAYHIKDGKSLWQRTLAKDIHINFAAADNVFIGFDDSKTLTARSLHDGETLWRKTYPKLYAAPVTVGATFWFVRKNKDKQKGAAGYYVLQGVNPRGDEIGALDLPANARPTAMSALSSDLLLMATELGQVFCFDTRKQQLLWDWQFAEYQYPQLGAIPDAIQGWALQDGRLLCATRSGQVAILAAGAQPVQESLTPQAYEQRGQTEQAAQAYALQRNFARAAQLYVELAQPEKAYALYAHAELWDDAGKLAESQGWRQRALTAFEHAQNLPAQAALLERQGSWIEAARKYEAAGNLRKAITCYENAKDWNQVVRVARDLGDLLTVAHARRQISWTFLLDADEIDQLEQQGKLGEAAKIAADGRYWHQAVDLYERAGDSTALLRTLEAALNENIKQEWAWQKYLTQLEQQAEASSHPDSYRKLLDALQTYLKHYPEDQEYLTKTAHAAQRGAEFRIEAQIWQQMQCPEKAAYAFWRAARQAQAKAQGKLFGTAQKTCAGYYRNAWQAFRELGMMTEFQECHNQWLQLEEQPWLTMDARIAHTFKEQGWNPIQITLKNIGKAAAQQVQIKIDETHFELDPTDRAKRATQLGPNTERPYLFTLRPRPGEFGDNVPLTITWQWRGTFTDTREEQETIHLQVLSKDDQTGSKPAQHFHVYAGGHVTQIDQQQNVGGNLLEEGAKIVAGNEIGGNQTNIQGDQVQGQKGDYLNISRKYGLVDAPVSASAELPHCPNCKLPLKQPDAQFCNECGAPLT
ncbi:MAG: hypothetical protein OHK0052_06930 [Anaerolineales bacterium]